MLRSGTAKLLKIYIGEDQHWQGHALYHALVVKARALGLAGATAYRGLEGYGPEKRLRTARILDLSVDLPVVVEIVDTEENIERFLPYVREMVKKGLVTLSEVAVLGPE